MKTFSFTKFSLIFILTAGFLLTPFNGVTTPKLDAAQTWQWARITDNNFMSNHNSVYTTTADLENNIIYMYGEGGGNAIYAYNGESTSLISDSLTPGESYGFTSMTFWNGKLYAAFTNFENPKLFSYDGESWTEEEIPLPRAETTSIVRLDVVGGMLFEWTLTATDRFIDVYDGNNWYHWGTQEDFGEWDLFNSELVGVTTSDEALYIALCISSTTTSVWKFDYTEGTWSQVGSTITGAVSDIQYFNEGLFIGTADYPSKVYMFNGFNWQTQTTDGFGNLSSNRVELVIYAYNLYAIVSMSANENASLYKYRSGNNAWDLMSSFIGEDNEEIKNSWVTSAIGFNDYLFVASSQLGEGPYNPIGWLYSPTDLTDFDGDGMSNLIEDSATDNGQSVGANDIPDSHNPQVVSFTNPHSGNLQVLFTDCTYLDNVSLATEASNSTQDEAFDYSTGFVNFNLHCEGEGGNVALMYFGDYDPSVNVIRKYNRNTGIYTTFTDFEIPYADEEEQIYILTYALVDGGEYDEDGVVNGVIVDPVGVGINAAGVPNTGIPQTHK
jgi:hypothetical protein